jgi:hypothetical protein
LGEIVDGAPAAEVPVIKEDLVAPKSGGAHDPVGVSRRVVAGQGRVPLLVLAVPGQPQHVAIVAFGEFPLDAQVNHAVPTHRQPRRAVGRLEAGVFVRDDALQLDRRAPVR